MKFTVLYGAFILCLSACDNKHATDFIIPSASVLDDQIHLSIYGETQDQQTYISANLYRNHKDGYRQYLVLSDGDSLSASHEGLNTEFESTVVEPLFSYFDVDIDVEEIGDVVSIELVRDGNSNIAASLTVLSETPFTVTSDVEPISLQSSIISSWEALEDYRYEMEFGFSCDNSEGTKIGSYKHFPSRTMSTLVSPFTLDLGQISPPPSDAVNCSVTVSLLSEQNQSESQVPISDNIHVYAARKQSQVILIDNSVVE